MSTQEMGLPDLGSLEVKWSFLCVSYSPDSKGALRVILKTSGTCRNGTISLPSYPLSFRCPLCPEKDTSLNLGLGVRDTEYWLISVVF